VPAGVLTWDGTGEKIFETGVDQGVLYLLNTTNGLYDDGVPWNGLTAVNEKPAGAAANPTYADNIKYSNIRSAETFGGTLEAYTFPDEFAACDGQDAPATGVTVGQQGRATFGLSYRTKVGNDSDADAGFKYHLVYGATAAPSEKDYATVNDSPTSVQFSWDFDCTPVNVTGLNPTCILVIDSTKVDSTALSTLLDDLHGTVGTNPILPDPDTVLALFTGSVTAITLTAPTFDGAHTITIPSQTGVKYYVDGVLHSAGSHLLTTGQSKIVTAVAQPGYKFNTPVVTQWMFTFVS
jgi:hypothetical protein